MKILFTADTHIKLNQKNVPIEWAKNRYNLLIAQLTRLQDNCDLFVIGGDIFDRLPTMEELEVYYDLIDQIQIPCIIYPGNHESLKKDTTFLTYLKRSTSRLNPKVQIIDECLSIDNMDFIPYNKLKEALGTNRYDFSGDILFTHVRAEVPPHVKAEINLDLLNPWKLVLAGDLHSYENSQRNILYPGSPVTTSFHRNSVDTGVIILDTSTLTHEWVTLDLPQLIRKTIKVGDPMVATSPDHTIYELEGNMAELANMEDNELIDKKLVKRDIDTALILDPSLTLVEEVVEYLTFILELEPEVIEACIQLLNNNMEKIHD